MSMLVPAFARTASKRRVERNTFVICREASDTYSMRDFFAKNWNKLNHTSEMDKIFIGLCRNSNIFQHKSRRTELSTWKVGSWASLGGGHLQQMCKRIVRIGIRSWKLAHSMRKSVQIYFRRENEISMRHATFFRHAAVAENQAAWAVVQGLMRY